MVFSFVYGALKAVSPILIIILMAIFSYNVLLKTEKMEIIKQQFSSISTDNIQYTAPYRGFGGLLEAMAGFGTAVAIPAAILISLGFKPIFSATVSLIANSVATSFWCHRYTGTGTCQRNQSGCTGAEYERRTATFRTNVPDTVGTALPDRPENKIITQKPISGTAGRRCIFSRAIRCGPIYGGRITGYHRQHLVYRRYRHLWQLTAPKKEKAQQNALKRKDILNAWSIYLLILLLIILTISLFPGLRSTLENNWVTRISLPINGSTVNYTIAWLTHAGVLLFVGTFVGGLIQGAKVKELFIVLWNTVKQLKKTFVTVICLVGLSTIMDTAAVISVIATALATATGSLYPLFAPVIGCLGTFITGSDTSSNILSQAASQRSRAYQCQSRLAIGRQYGRCDRR